MSPLPIEAIFLRLLGHFEACGIPYMIMGGMAVRALGIPRPTYDGDLTIDASEDQIATVLSRLEADGFTVPDEFRKGYRDWLAGMRKLALKLIAWRPNDRGDINDLLILHRPLDAAYLRHWAGELNVTDRLDEAMKAAEES